MALDGSWEDALADPSSPHGAKPVAMVPATAVVDDGRGAWEEPEVRHILNDVHEL